ncbi:MAG: hypothetical protein ACRDO1_02720 [Nocardioidaceae bacterium]
MRDLSGADALRLRHHRQLLGEAVPDPVEVARRLSGLHAQVTSAAELIAGVRSGLPPASVRDALWRQRTLDHPLVEITPFEPVTRRVRALAEERAGAIGDLLGAPAEVTWVQG